MADRASLARTSLVIALAHDTFWLEVSLALATMAWSNAVYLMPGDLADRPAYVVAARFASDELWDTMGCIGAVVQLLAAFAHRRLARFLVAVGMGAFWIVLANDVAAAGREFSPGIVLYYAFAAFNAVCLALPLIRRLPVLRG